MSLSELVEDLLREFNFFAIEQAVFFLCLLEYLIRKDCNDIEKLIYEVNLINLLIMEGVFKSRSVGLEYRFHYVSVKLKSINKSKQF